MRFPQLFSIRRQSERTSYPISLIGGQLAEIVPTTYQMSGSRNYSDPLFWIARENSGVGWVGSSHAYRL